MALYLAVNTNIKWQFKIEKTQENHKVLTNIPDHIPWAPFPWAVHTKPATAQPNPQPSKMKPIIPAPIAIFFETLPGILKTF